MSISENEPLIISASRTKDMVHRSPSLLASILLGESPCRWGPHGPLGQVRPERIHTLVLWTKNPQNLLQHNLLRRALFELRDCHNVQISLQITATGLGSSFVEPGIPVWQVVLSQVASLLLEGWIAPANVIFRYDPFLQVRTSAGRMLGNFDMELFAEICQSFIALGIVRITTSRADAVRYPRVLERVRMLGLEWLPPDDRAAAEFCAQMSAFCLRQGASFSICCDPPLELLLHNWGCIDARWLNRNKGEGCQPAPEVLHNQVGKQRPACRCTYSRDIGYSPGSATCYSGGFGCLYCYAQGNAHLPNLSFLQDEIRQFDLDPLLYLSQKNLPPQLYTDARK
ncbi:MAG: DUF1848 family protein [bacterium]